MEWWPNTKCFSLTKVWNVDHHRWFLGFEIFKRSFEDTNAWKVEKLWKLIAINEFQRVKI